MERRTITTIVLFFSLSVSASFANGNGVTSHTNAANDIYDLVATKYGIDANALKSKAIELSGKEVSFSDHKAPWPWTIQYCSPAQCKTVFVDDRNGMQNTAKYFLDQGLSISLGPLLMPWETYRSQFSDNLWLVTDPRVSINMVARHWKDQFDAGKAVESVADTSAVTEPDLVFQAPGLRVRILEKPQYAHIVERVARQHEGVDPRLVNSIIYVESNYKRDAVSSAGAVGLMQLMPETGKRFGVLPEQRTDPVKNITGGIKYLAYLSKLFKGNTVLMLSAYNAGEGAVKKYNNKTPPYKETIDYVVKVLAHYVSTVQAELGKSA